MVTGTVTELKITSVEKLKAKCTKADDNEIEVEIGFKTSLLPRDVHQLLLLMQGSVPIECIFTTPQSRMNFDALGVPLPNTADATPDATPGPRAKSTTPGANGHEPASDPVQQPASAVVDGKAEARRDPEAAHDFPTSGRDPASKRRGRTGQ